MDEGVRDDFADGDFRVEPHFVPQGFADVLVLGQL